MAIDPDGPDVFEPRAKADRSITALLSDLASGITGEILYVDAGFNTTTAGLGGEE